VDTFDYRKPTKLQVAWIKEWRARLKNAAALIKDLPSSREASLALTKLEEAAMWGNKAAVFRDVPHAELWRTDGWNFAVAHCPNCDVEAVFREPAGNEWHTCSLCGHRYLIGNEDE
jgi:hypothetical protein